MSKYCKNEPSLNWFPCTLVRYNVSIELLFPVIVIAAFSPVFEETVDVTIPTMSPTAYPFPGDTIVGVPVISPFVVEIFKINPYPCPIILNVETEASVT